MIRWLPIITVTLFLGLVLGSQSEDRIARLLNAYVAEAEKAELVSCAEDVDRAGWQMFRDVEAGFELAVPPSFSMTAVDGGWELRPTIGDLPVVRFTKLRERLRSAMEDVPYQFAGYKVRDRQHLVLASPAFSEDMDTVTSSYLFVRDFELSDRQAVVIFKADIRDSAKNPVFMLARSKGISDVESVLTEAQQILSTFRFLSYEEIYGPAGQQ